MSVIDTSKMSIGQRAALETAEAARESVRVRGFAASLFNGRPDWAALLPFPLPTVETEDQGDAFLARLDALLSTVDADEIDRLGEIPDEVFEGLARLGAFGIKIPASYGGVGLSQTNYSRIAMRLGGFCGNLTALLSAHQSIGVPQPLMMFGSDEQKAKFLPLCARGVVTAFALTEADVGSDPARMRTTATPTEDGHFFLLNGEKLWCTNGTKAGLLVVMARTPARDTGARTPITAFIVEADTPGIEIVHRCRFMGLRALYNGVLRFRDVRVPRENILLAEGKGLRVALSTLNIGRITLPAACAGLARRCLDISLRWASEREQWGSKIGAHAAVADKLARMAAHTFALESLVHYISALVDSKTDVRLEAALAKLWGTERAWEIVDATMQLRGGRGYETAQSLEARGERGEPVERFFRDARINTIFEGSSEIMRLFIAREALDPHLQAGAPLLDSRLSWKQRLQSVPAAMKFYARLFPGLILPARLPAAGPFQQELRDLATLSRQLGRSLMIALTRFGPKLEREQLVLGRLVDSAAELLAAFASVARALALRDRLGPDEAAKMDETVTFICLLARQKVRTLLHRVTAPTDHAGYRLAQRYLSAEKVEG